MYYSGGLDDFVGLADARHMGRRHPPGQKFAQHMRRRGHAGFGFFGAASTLPRLNRPAYPFKGYACKAGGGVRQNQLKAEAFCAATQANQAIVSSCSPFQWYCDPTRPVRKRAGNPKAPAGQIAFPGGGAYPAPAPSYPTCPDGVSMPNPVTGQCPGVTPQQGCTVPYATSLQFPMMYAPGVVCPPTTQPGVLPPGAMLMAPGQLCPAGYAQQFYNGQYYCVPTGSVSGLPPGSMLMTPGQVCPPGYTQQIYNGQYYCVPLGAAGACPPGAMFNQSTNSCVSAISGQPIVGPSYYQPPPYPGYYPPSGYMPPAPYGYTGPELTPIDGGGGDMSTGGTPIYSGGAPTYMAPMSMDYGPQLDPIGAGGVPDMTGGGPGMQFTDQAAFNQAAGGTPSPTSAQSNQPCQQEVVSKPGSDQFGPLQIIQIVCASTAPAGATPSGSPFPGVYNPDEIAQQEISTFTGLGRYIG